MTHNINIILYLIGIINIIIIMSNPATASSVNFADKYNCICGQETLVMASIFGDAHEFGSYNRGEYEFRLYDGDPITDDILISVNGMYDRALNWSDNVMLSVTFILKCSDDCKKVTGIGIKNLDIFVNGELQKAEEQKHDMELDPGQYYVDAGYSDSDDNGQEQLVVELDMSRDNIPGSTEFKCVQLIADLSTIFPKIIGNEQKNLTIEIPEEGENSSSFSIEIEAINFDTLIYDTRVKWLTVPENAKFELDHIRYFNPYSPAKFITWRNKSVDNLTFYVRSGAIEGKYDMDIYIYYTVGRTYGSKKVDPSLYLFRSPLTTPIPTSVPTIPTDHPPMPPDTTGCTGTDCHSRIRGPSLNFYSTMLLGISLLVIGMISILVITRKNR